MKFPKITWKRGLLYGGILLVFVLIVRAFAQNGPRIEYDTQKAERATLRQTVEVTGEVVSSADVDLKFESSGRLVAVGKKVGDAVKAGDILANLDDRNERVRVQSAQAALLSAQASLDRLQHGATAEDLRITEVTVENAQTALEQAKQAFTDAQASNLAALNKAYGDLDGQMESLYLKASAAMQAMRNDVFDAAGSLKSDISCPDFSLQSQALSQYTSASAAMTAMGKDIAAYRVASTRADKDRLSATLLDEGKTIRLSAQLTNAMMQVSTPTGSTSVASFDARKSDVKAVWTDLNASVSAAESQKLHVATTIATTATSSNVAQQNVKTMEGSLASAQANLNLKKAPATTYDLAAARASVSQASASLGEASIALDHRRIRAPYDGNIAAIVGRVGQTLTPNDVVLKLHGLDVYEIEADVPETDIAKLRVGMKAEMTLDAYGDDKVFAGELATIDTAQTVIQDVVYYKTRFRFVANEDVVRAGMTSTVTVVTVERADALIIPQRAVREDEDGKKFVRVLENGQEARRDVQLGVRGDDGLIEILGGLSGEEEVILSIRENGEIKR